MCENKPYRNCPICGSIIIKKLYTQRFVHNDFIKSHMLLPEKYDIVACSNCGFVYADTPIEQSGYDMYYEKCSKYEGNSDVSTGGFSSFDIVRYEIIVKQLKKYLNKDINILDIGCANGGLLYTFKEFGFNNVFGLDPSHVCINNLKNIGITGYEGTLFNNKLNVNKKYGLIILSHVFEHIRDLNDAMKIVADLLNEKGLIYIEVPNARKYISNYNVPFYYFDSEHINHFDIVSLNNLLMLNGIEYIDSIEKDIMVSGTQNYPAVSVLGIKTGNGVFKYLKNAKIDEFITKYIEKSKQDEKYSNIDKIINLNEKIIIWGAGSYTTRLLAETKLSKCNITMFVDNDLNKQGTKINGIEVKRPDALYGIESKILVASVLHSEDIKSQIRYMGLKNEVVLL